MNSEIRKPPGLFLRFFRWFCHPELEKYIEGDLMELYDERVTRSSKWKADLRFVLDVILLFRPGIIRSPRTSRNINTYDMYKSYFTIGWRNILRNKGYSFINIGGLAIGMAVAMLLGLWVYDEVSYNRNFTHYDRLVRVMQNQTFDGEIKTWESQAMQLATALRNNYGGNFEHVITSTWTWSHKITYGDKSLMKSGNFMEPAVTEMFDLEMIKGSRSGLKDMHSILLSESAAIAIFGEEDPLDKSLKIDDKLDVKVTGVYKDMPRNCHYSSLEMILPWELHATSEQLEQRQVGWGNSWFQTLAMLAENKTVEEVSANIKDAKLKGVIAAGDDDDRFKPEIFVFPMSDWRLYSSFKNGVSVGGGILIVRMFAVVGIFVLLLACINFMNLSTARSERRAREVGIRKSIGSARSQLIAQFFTESMVVAVLAFVIALVLVQTSLPWFNQIANKRVAILWTNAWFWAAGIGFAVVTGIIAGSYPALFLSSFQPVKVLKGVFRSGRVASMPRKVLVVVQFTVSVTLVIGTLIVFRQIKFAQDRPIGYDRTGLVSSPMRGEEIRKHFDVFREELIKTGAVIEVAGSGGPITSISSTNSGFDWKGKDPQMNEEFVTHRVTHDFGKTINWEIVEGRDFSKDIAGDSGAFIINESAAKYMNMENPVGEIMKWKENGDWRIIGVVKDVITESPYASVRPAFFELDYDRIWTVNMRMNPGMDVREGLARVESVFKKYDPINAFEYYFTDQEFARKFGNEQRIGNLALIFAGLAIFISCLGLFGLASFVAEQRTKEIGIRKVLGASVAQLWRLLSRDFVVLVVVSCVISIPLSFYFMDNWLRSYTYRISISWQIFAIACMAALGITLLTVSFQTIRAAFASPVKSLRSE